MNYWDIVQICKKVMEDPYLDIIQMPEDNFLIMKFARDQVGFGHDKKTIEMIFTTMIIYGDSQEEDNTEPEKTLEELYDEFHKKGGKL